MGSGDVCAPLGAWGPYVRPPPYGGKVFGYDDVSLGHKRFGSPDPTQTTDSSRTEATLDVCSGDRTEPGSVTLTVCKRKVCHLLLSRVGWY